MSVEPEGADERDLLTQRFADPLRAAFALAIVAVVVLYILDYPGTRVGVFVATAIALLLSLALAIYRMRTGRALVASRLGGVTPQTVVVAGATIVPAFRHPALFLQRRPDGLHFTRVSDPAQSVLLKSADIHSVDVTTFPSGIVITLADGTRIPLRVVLPRLSGARPTDLLLLREWLARGAKFPERLGATTFRG